MKRAYKYVVIGECDLWGGVYDSLKQARSEISKHCESDQGEWDKNYLLLRVKENIPIDGMLHFRSDYVKKEDEL